MTFLTQKYIFHHQTNPESVGSSLGSIWDDQSTFILHKAYIFSDFINPNVNLRLSYMLGFLTLLSIYFS